MNGTLYSKTMREAEFDAVYDIIDQLSQYDTKTAPFIKRKKFKIDAVGDGYILSYTVMNNEKCKEEKAKAFKEYGFKATKITASRENLLL